MNTAAYLPLYDYLNTLPEPETPEEISAVSYSNILDDLSIAMIDYRLKHHMNQTQFAEFLTCSQSLVSAYESGARNISAEKLCELMAKLGKKVSLSIEDVTTTTMPQSGSDPLFPDAEVLDNALFAS